MICRPSRTFSTVFTAPGSLRRDWPEDEIARVLSSGSDGAVFPGHFVARSGIEPGGDPDPCDVAPGEAQRAARCAVAAYVARLTLLRIAAAPFPGFPRSPHRRLAQGAERAVRGMRGRACAGAPITDQTRARRGFPASILIPELRTARTRSAAQPDFRDSKIYVLISGLCHQSWIASAFGKNLPRGSL